MIICSIVFLIQSSCVVVLWRIVEVISILHAEARRKKARQPDPLFLSRFVPFSIPE